MQICFYGYYLNIRESVCKGISLYDATTKVLSFWRPFLVSVYAELFWNLDSIQAAIFNETNKNSRVV